ncbi:MAG: response regulator [Deltaproteobacteria bacterium]|nr:response regulator [Deltaproteobacteria bacterium]
MSGAPRLLIVDDNRDLAEDLDHIFAARGFSVRHAFSAQEGLSEARREGFELAFVDVNLPDADGTGLLPALREAAPLGEVVVITGHATVDSAVTAVRGGAFHYVVKPFKVEDLITTAEGALRQAQLRRDRAELARRATEAEALAHMGTLAAGLAHEVRNPLNAALLQLHLLGRGIDRLGEPGRTPLRNRVDIVTAELRRLERLLSDFLELARPRPLAREPVPLRALLGDVLRFHEPAASERGVRLVGRVGDCVVLGDRERLKQVFHNLVVNALEASAEGGLVTVASDTLGGSQGPRVQVTIADTGRGIPREALEKVFEPFFTTKEAGTGLGLAIVRQLVERHRGRVSIDSVEGTGTTITVVVPAADAPTTTPPPGPGPTP